ncbi:hypothetical protein C3941_26095 [Kaistia algarum]|nr:hypothetical protein C3941_26095 [Kaistia algarum]
MEVSPLLLGYAYAGLAVVLIAIACLVQRDEWRRLLQICFLSISFLALFVSRLPMLFYDRAINPDEALMGANAMRARWGWISWDIVDPLTAGPIDSMVLVWPRLFGLDITFFNIRLTAIVLLAISMSLLASALRRLFDARVAMVATLPAYLFLIFTNFFDFVHYSSEIMPIFLISLGIFGLAIYAETRRTWFLLLAAFAAGCVPFAKLQGTPIAALVGALALLCACRPAHPATLSLRLKRAAAVIAAACVPAAAFLLPLTLSGGGDDFVKSYFVQQKLRIVGQQWSDKIWHLLSWTSFGQLAFTYLAMLCIGMVVMIALFAWRRSRPGRLALRFASVAVVMAAVSYAAAVTPGRDFSHYLLFGLPALVMIGAAASLLATNGGTTGRWGTAAASLCLVGVALYLLLPRLAQERAYGQPWSTGWNEGIYLKGKPFKALHTLQWLRPEPGDRMVCWGWQAECYVDAAMAPATREATNENQLYWTELRSYFRSRFIGDLKRDPPAYIVDAVAPGSFFFEDPSQYGIRAFPEFAEVVDGDYVPVSKVANPESCPRVYALRERAESLERSRIAFASIAASSAEPGFDPTSLDDGSIFESCADYWLAREGSPASIRMTFAAPSPVKRILLLNTRDGVRNTRAGGIARLVLLSKGREVWTHFLELEPFPRWTEVKLPAPLPEADAFQLDLLSFRGAGGGLNEVKLYRD